MNPIYYGLAYNMNGYLAHRSDIFLTLARSKFSVQFAKYPHVSYFKTFA